MDEILKLRMLEAEKRLSVIWTNEKSIQEYYSFKIKISNSIGFEKVKKYMEGQKVTI